MFLLLQTGDYLLLQTGDKLLLEEGVFVVSTADYPNVRRRRR